MKHILIILLLFLTFSVLSKEKVVILEFKSIGVEKNTIDYIHESLLTAIINTDKFVVLERGQLDKIFKELNLVNSDEFTEDEIIEIGKLAKAKIGIIGSVAKGSDVITINVRGVNIETGDIKFAKSINIYSDKEIVTATKELAGLLTSKSSTTSTLYTKKIIPPIVLCSVGTVMMIGGGIGVGLCAYQMEVERNEYITNPKVTLQTYTNNKNSLIAGIAVSSAVAGVGLVLTIVSIPLFVIADKYKREYSFFIDWQEELKTGIAIKF